jgi:hypothetical protein
VQTRLEGPTYCTKCHDWWLDIAYDAYDEEYQTIPPQWAGTFTTGQFWLQQHIHIMDSPGLHTPCQSMYVRPAHPTFTDLCTKRFNSKPTSYNTKLAPSPHMTRPSKAPSTVEVGYTIHGALVSQHTPQEKDR